MHVRTVTSLQLPCMSLSGARRSESSAAVLREMRAALDRIGGPDPEALPESDAACRAAFLLADYADSMYRCCGSLLSPHASTVHSTGDTSALGHALPCKQPPRAQWTVTGGSGSGAISTLGILKFSHCCAGASRSSVSPRSGRRGRLSSSRNGSRHGLLLLVWHRW